MLPRRNGNRKRLRDARVRRTKGGSEKVYFRSLGYNGGKRDVTIIPFQSKNHAPESQDETG